jgi:hypothetical protein
MLCTLLIEVSLVVKLVLLLLLLMVMLSLSSPPHSSRPRLTRKQKQTSFFCCVLSVRMQTPC